MSDEISVTFVDTAFLDSARQGMIRAATGRVDQYVASTNPRSVAHVFFTIDLAHGFRPHESPLPIGREPVGDERPFVTASSCGSLTLRKVNCDVGWFRPTRFEFLKFGSALKLYCLSGGLLPDRFHLALHRNHARFVGTDFRKDAALWEAFCLENYESKARAFGDFAGVV